MNLTTIKTFLFWSAVWKYQRLNSYSGASLWRKEWEDTERGTKNVGCIKWGYTNFSEDFSSLYYGELCFKIYIIGNYIQERKEDLG